MIEIRDVLTDMCLIILSGSTMRANGSGKELDIRVCPWSARQRGPVGIFKTTRIDRKDLASGLNHMSCKLMVEHQSRCAHLYMGRCPICDLTIPSARVHSFLNPERPEEEVHAFTQTTCSVSPPWPLKTSERYRASDTRARSFCAEPTWPQYNSDGWEMLTNPCVVRFGTVRIPWTKNHHNQISETRLPRAATRPPWPATKQPTAIGNSPKRLEVADPFLR